MSHYSDFVLGGGIFVAMACFIGSDVSHPMTEALVSFFV